MIKRVQKHIRTTEQENEIQELLENTTYYDQKQEKAEKKLAEKVFHCRICDVEIS
jgi:hypothetical protein